MKLARSNELTSELYLCVHNYYKKYVLSQSMDISEHNFRKLKTARLPIGFNLTANGANPALAALLSKPEPA